MKPRTQVEASAAGMDDGLQSGLTLGQLVALVLARADARDLDLAPDLADPAVRAAHTHPGARLVDEVHVARTLRRR